MNKDRKNLEQNEQKDMSQENLRENVSLNENEDVSIPRKDQEGFEKNRQLDEQTKRTDRSDRRL